jgi:membrane protease YdiL (CAAX protease family)
MNPLPIISGYFVPIAVVVAIFLAFKVKRPKLPNFESSKTEANIALLLFILFAAIIVASSLIFTPAQDIDNLTSAGKIRSFLLWLLLLSPLIVTLTVRKQSLNTCLLPTKNFFLHLLTSVGMGFLGILIYVLTIGKVNMLPLAVGNLFTLSSLFFLVIIFFEEFVFRGFFLARFTAGFGRHKGILLSAALFGLIHYPRYLIASQMNFLQVTQVVLLIIAVSVGGGYGIYSVRCMLYGVFIHWCMNSVQVSIPPS